MKSKTILIIIALSLHFVSVRGQIPVTDAVNVSQSIINSIQEIAQTSTTASNMIKNFQETVRIYKQGKEYYDALKNVHNLVKSAKKVQKTILAIGEISDIYVTSYQKMLKDQNYTVEELTAIAFGYTQLLQEATDILTELKNIVNTTGMSLSDKERLDAIDQAYNSVIEYRNLVSYYTNKNIGISYLRASRKNEIKKFVSLYGNKNEKYW